MKKLIATAVLLGLTATATAEDRFADIRQTWATCAACHGPQGQGNLGPRLNNQSADDIISKLLTYKAGGTIGPQSMLMWPTAKQLTDGQIGTIGVYIQEGMPKQ